MGRMCLPVHQWRKRSYVHQFYGHATDLPTKILPVGATVRRANHGSTRTTHRNQQLHPAAGLESVHRQVRMEDGMSIRVLVGVALAAMNSAAVAQFNTGNDLIKLAQASDRVSERRATDEDRLDASLYLGYLQGVFDANKRILACTPDEFTGRQLKGIVTAYLKANPALWNLSGDFLVVRAVATAFPCQPGSK